jgi:hypothetical protein
MNKSAWQKTRNVVVVVSSINLNKNGHGPVGCFLCFVFFVFFFFQFYHVGSVGGSTLRGVWNLALNGDMF